MGKRIDEETIILINEIFLETGVKSKTAKVVGVSPATVSKYLIEGYVSQKEKKPLFDKRTIQCRSADFLINKIKEEEKNYIQSLCDICLLTVQEKEELLELQKGITI